MAQQVNLNDPNVLVAVLTSLTQNDTAVIRQAEKALKPFTKTVACIPAFITQLQNLSESHIQVRHQSALLLKTKIAKLYPKCSAQQREQIKVTILKLVVEEPNKAVRTAIAGVTAALAGGVFKVDKDWSALFDLLLQLAQNPVESMRALNFNILEQLCEHIGTHLKKHTQTLSQMFIMGCQDASPAVAVDAMTAAANYFKFLANNATSEQGPEIMQMESVLMPMLVVMQGCLQRGDEQVVTEGLDVLQECCMMEQPLINNHIEAVLPFVMSIVQNETYDPAVKHAAGETLIQLISCRPKLIAKKNLVEPILQALVQMLAQGDNDKSLFMFNQHSSATVDEDDDEDDDEDADPEEDLKMLAQRTLDVMAMHIPSKHFTQPALAIAAQCLDSPDSKLRKAGCALLGIIVEGCNDTIKTILGQIVPKLVASTQDSEYFVRECACFALGQFSEHCQPDILYHHQLILPAIFKVLEDERPTVQSTSCYVLEMFSENLQPETLRPMLQTLVEKLLRLLTVGNAGTKEVALSALAACSVAAELDFLPYADACCQVIAPLMFNTDISLYSLRGRALECWGHIGIAIGKDNFARYLDTGFQSAMQGIQLDDVSLKEFAYVFFANAVKVMGNAFDPHLKDLVAHLTEIIEESELTQVDDDEEEEEEEEEEDDDYQGGGYRLNVHEGFINTKKAALTALGALAEHTKVSFYPYLEDSMGMLLMEGIGACYSYHGAIRAEAMTCLEQLTQVVCAKHGPHEDPLKGVTMTLNTVVTEVMKAALTTFINVMDQDAEKEPVAAAVEGVAAILNRIGIAALSIMTDDKPPRPMAEPLFEVMTKLVNEKAACHTESNFEQHEGDDDDDHDAIVMDSVSDLIGTLGKVMGAAFMPVFDSWVKPLLKFSKPNRLYTDRSMVIGCFAEVVGEFGAPAIKYADVLLPIIKVGLGDEMEPVRRNAAYAVGVFVEATGDALGPNILPMLQALHPVCIRAAHQQGSDCGGADIDNALAAVARIVVAMPSVVPLAQMLPVVVAALPLRVDMSEGPTVYGMFAKLVAASEPVTMAMLPQVLTLFAEVLSSQSKAEDETKKIVTTSLKSLVANRAQASVFMTAVGSLTDPSIKPILEAAVNSA